MSSWCAWMYCIYTVCICNMYVYARTHTPTDLRGLDELLVLHQRAAQRMGLAGVLHAAAQQEGARGVIPPNIKNRKRGYVGERGQCGCACGSRGASRPTFSDGSGEQVRSVSRGVWTNMQLQAAHAFGGGPSGVILLMRIHPLTHHSGQAFVHKMV